MTVNTPRDPVYTAPGARAAHINPEQQLRRSVMSCLLWEDEAYEDGQSVASRIIELVPQVKPEIVAEMALSARESMKLRHVPLLLAREMARYDSHKALVAETLAKVIQRADELTEFVAIYWKDGKEPLSAQVKKGLAKAFCKFSEYDLAKYNRSGRVKLKDVLFMCHAKPKDHEQRHVWRRLVEGTLATPDTWEVSLSDKNGISKREKWVRLLGEKKLGGLALLRNLRNMFLAEVPLQMILTAINEMDARRILPFRFLAARAAIKEVGPLWPALEDILRQKMRATMNPRKQFFGRTLIIVDMSGSMHAPLSSHSVVSRSQAAIAIAIILREMCQNVGIYATAGDDHTQTHSTIKLDAVHDFALEEQFELSPRKIGGGGIFLNQAMDYIYEMECGQTPERIVVLSDEEDCDWSKSPLKANAFGHNNYLINVASSRNGIGYGKWTHIDGWSEHVLDYIYFMEYMQF